MRLGSKNSAFFHAQTVVRRKSNKIHGLFLNPCICCNNFDQLQAHVVEFFKRLFCVTEGNILHFSLPLAPILFGQDSISFPARYKRGVYMLCRV